MTTRLYQGPSLEVRMLKSLTKLHTSLTKSVLPEAHLPVRRQMNMLRKL